MKTPERYMMFLTEGLSAIHQYQASKATYDVNEDPHFHFILMIQDIALPWLKEDKNVLESIAKGISNFADYSGYSFFHSAIGHYLLAYGKDFDNGTPHRIYWKEN